MLNSIWSLCEWRERMTAKHYRACYNEIEIKFY